ncbi:hypothetical protein DRQ26_00680 [bacterium]|nr:MAG: hypothetical protein DRQ26_00680 [bacterium]
MKRSENMIYEDWKKEYEKFVLTKKYSEATSAVGRCFANPSIENIKIAYGLVQDYVSSIPLPMNNKGEKRKEFLGKLDEIALILYGTESDEVKKICEKYKVKRGKIRNGISVVDTIIDAPNLIIAIRDLLIEAGEYATSLGLRVTMSPERKFGLKRILEEEGFLEDEENE